VVAPNKTVRRKKRGKRKTDGGYSLNKIIPYSLYTVRKEQKVGIGDKGLVICKE